MEGFQLASRWGCTNQISSPQLAKPRCHIRLPWPWRIPVQVLQLSAYYMIFHAQICQTIRKNIFKNIPGIWGAQGQKYSRYSPRGGYQIPLAKNIPKHSKKNIPKKIFQHLRGIPGIFKIGAPHPYGSCLKSKIRIWERWLCRKTMKNDEKLQMWVWYFFMLTHHCPHWKSHIKISYISFMGILGLSPIFRFWSNIKTCPIPTTDVVAPVPTSRRPDHRSCGKSSHRSSSPEVTGGDEWWPVLQLDRGVSMWISMLALDEEYDTYTHDGSMVLVYMLTLGVYWW